MKRTGEYLYDSTTDSLSDLATEENQEGFSGIFLLVYFLRDSVRKTWAACSADVMSVILYIKSEGHVVFLVV